MRRPLSRRRRIRVVVEALAVVAGVLLLAWAAESLARAGAESLLERNIQQTTGVVDPTEVVLAPGVVLPAAIRGVYPEAAVSVNGVRSGPLRIEQVQATFDDVRMPLGDLLLRDSRRVGVGASQDRVTLTLDDLNHYFDVTGRSVRLTQDRNGELRMTGFFDVLGQTVRVTGPVELAVDGTQLRVEPRRIDTGDAKLSRVGRLLLDQRLDLTVPLDTLPFGNQLTGVAVHDDLVVLTAQSSGPLLLRP